jgi:hypothetical protein
VNFSGKHAANPEFAANVQRGHERPHAGFNAKLGRDEKAEQCSGTRNKRSVWEVATQPFSEAHFATYPPALIEPCILAGCPVGGTVLDPFGGAGTTGLVADRLQRDAILIELNPEYAEIARNRIASEAGMFGEVLGSMTSGQAFILRTSPARLLSDAGRGRGSAAAAPSAKMRSFIEPCAGNGRLIDHLGERRPPLPLCLDIEPQRGRHQCGDALSYHAAAERIDFIITNPPWDERFFTRSSRT